MRRCLAFLPALFLAGCGADVKGSPSVVLYCSVDQDQSKPIQEDFEKQTGIRVVFQGETEASRSLGVTHRIAFEKEHPVADVLWANEIMNTVFLRDLGALAPLPAGVAEGFPAAWRDTKGRYVAFAARARILLVNTTLLPDPATWPSSIEDLVDPRWGGEGRRVAVAQPLVGTTFTHAVVLLTKDEEKAKAFYAKVADRSQRGEVKVVPGNGPVMNLVADAANGVAWGVTDTDDATAAIHRPAPVAIVYPDQGEGKPGTLVIPNTVALVRGGPNPASAERLLTWLVAKDVEARLAASDVASIPLRDDVPAPATVKRPGKDFRAMEVDWDAVGANRERWGGFLRSLFAK